MNPSVFVKFTNKFNQSISKLFSRQSNNTLIINAQQSVNDCVLYFIIGFYPILLKTKLYYFQIKCHDKFCKMHKFIFIW